MQGHVARKRGRYYAVIYEGLDPITGREKRSWHPAGTDHAEAEALAAQLAAERDGRNDEIRALTFGAYLTGHWLPAKKVTLKTSTHRGYVHKTQRHILPTLGRKRLRRLRPQHLERFYDSMLHPTDGRRPLAPKTVYEVHLIIRGAGRSRSSPLPRLLAVSHDWASREATRPAAGRAPRHTRSSWARPRARPAGCSPPSRSMTSPPRCRRR